jgi:hypothetical protein
MDTAARTATATPVITGIKGWAKTSPLLGSAARMRAPDGCVGGAATSMSSTRLRVMQGLEAIDRAIKPCGS